jgi:hypothetical protein
LGIGSWADAFLPLTLQVKDRHNGRLRSTVLVPAQYEGERYLVSMLGDGSEWVQNVRAACGEAFIKRGWTHEITLAEVPPKHRAPILKAWSQIATSGRKHLPVPYDAPVSAFEAIAADYPVFRIDGADRFASTPQGLGSKQAQDSAHPLRFLCCVPLLSIPFLSLGLSLANPSALAFWFSYSGKRGHRPRARCQVIPPPRKNSRGPGPSGAWKFCERKLTTILSKMTQAFSAPVASQARETTRSAPFAPETEVAAAAENCYRVYPWTKMPA